MQTYKRTLHGYVETTTAEALNAVVVKVILPGWTLPGGVLYPEQVREATTDFDGHYTISVSVPSAGAIPVEIQIAGVTVGLADIPGGTNANFDLPVIEIPVTTSASDEIEEHLNDFTNPHHTTPEQIGAAPVVHHHPIAEVDGLQTALDGFNTSLTNYQTALTALQTEITTARGVGNANLNLRLNAIEAALAAHTHAGRVVMLPASVMVLPLQGRAIGPYDITLSAAPLNWTFTPTAVIAKLTGSTTLVNVANYAALRKHGAGADQPLVAGAFLIGGSNRVQGIVPVNQANNKIELVVAGLLNTCSVEIIGYIT